ncbi:hypothetical protein SUGI_0651380 [Cryptomeria japonica]|nr:hypothetical protein SUGI_0651380 [Cryptomeria japonica]
MLKEVPSLGWFKTLDKVEQLADMLNRHGCTQDQIANITRLQPSLMMTSVERVLEPKIQLLKDLGIEGENIPRIVTTSSRFLASKLETLHSNLEFLKTIFPTNDFLVRAIMRSPFIIGVNLQVLKPSVAFWEVFGFHGIEFIKFLLIDPWVLMCSSLTPEQLDLIHKCSILKLRHLQFRPHLGLHDGDATLNLNGDPETCS